MLAPTGRISARRRHRRQELAHSFEGAADVVDAAGVGKAQIALAVGTEAGSRDGGDARLLEQARLQLVGVHPCPGDIGKGIEGAAGRSAADSFEGVEPSDDDMAALVDEPADHLGGLKGSQGDSFFNAENPPFGAVFTCYLRDSLKTKKEERKEKEKKVKKAGGDNPYPGWDVLKEEDREEAPAIVFEIRDAGFGATTPRPPGCERPSMHKRSSGVQRPGARH